VDKTARTGAAKTLQKQVGTQNGRAVDEADARRIAAKSLFPWSAAWASPFKQEEKEPVIATT
jgi:hypothetical protein